MNIIFDKDDWDEIKKVAHQEDVDPCVLAQMYTDSMESNFQQDLADIARENAGELKEEEQ